jgi:tight adherence protein B
LSLRPLSASLAAAAALVVLVVPATAQAVLDLRLVDSVLETDGRTTLVVTVDGDEIGDDGVPVDSFSISENGGTVEGVEVTPIIEEAEAPPSTVVIAFDISGSAEGAPIDAARDAATSLVESVVPQGVAVGLVSFNSEAEAVVTPTTDITVLVGAIAGLEAGGNTALYDGIVLAAELLVEREGERSILLFTDGADTASEATLDDAVAASVEVDAPLINVALITPDQDPEVLTALTAGTEGRLLEAEGVSELEDAFALVARSLTSQYVIRYSSDVVSPELDLSITVDHGGQQARLDVVLLNPRIAPDPAEVLTPPEPVPVELPPAGALSEPLGLTIALSAAFLAFSLLGWLLLVPRGDRAAQRTLRRGVTMIQRGGVERASAESGLSASSIGRAAVDLVGKAPKPKGYDEKLQTDIDRAGWQLRSAEFTTIRVGALVFGFVLVWALTGSFIGGLIGGALGALAPVVLLSSAKSRRQAKFMKQLPDTLQLLAGTLKAGYGVLQAIDTVVKEVEEPTAGEFQRALTEARLGLPLEDSLGDMAERVDSDDFRWVVVAMNIQRQVGGNLAELLETVAATLRGREQVRRSIDSLSAEGKLSAIILIALPFVILGFLLLTNAAYIAPLFTTAVGWLMLGGVSVLMIIGIIWIRNLIAIDV